MANDFSFCFASLLGWVDWLPIAAFERIRNFTLVLGLSGIATGILLYINHKRHLDRVLSEKPSERIANFEMRKFRRRAVTSVMITSVGLMMAALFWVTDAKVFSSFILMILTLLVGILGIAFVDMFSVGLHQIGTPDERSQKAMIEEYLQKRQKEKDAEEQAAKQTESK